MKKALLSCVLTAALFTACSQDNTEDDRLVCVDITPICFYIEVSDPAGNDLLDESRPDNLLDAITVSYDETDYTVQERLYYYGDDGLESRSTRTYIPTFIGLWSQLSWNYATNTAGNYQVVFGEFAGEESVAHREITLHIGSHEATLAYSNSCKWTAGDFPDIDRHFYLNGQELTDRPANLGLYAFTYTPTDGLQLQTAH
ncbi:MAG: hypothetical protein IJ527_04230 [Prevotella sp.]|nr:hypothetical protein [Prevotella sp.]